MSEQKSKLRTLTDVFFAFLRLGLTSFGGPIAHLGYFRNEFVLKRKWLSDSAYADLVSLCQFLPGPASSQVSMALGYSQAQSLGAFAAWLAFTMPSALLLILLALGLQHFSSSTNNIYFHGLKIATVAIVAQAVWGMGSKLCTERKTFSLMIFAAILTLTFSQPWMQLLIIAGSAVIGHLLFDDQPDLAHSPFSKSLNRFHGALCLTVFLVGLLILPVLSKTMNNHALTQFDHFFRSGAMVFGGGHVVLPLLQSEVVNQGWVTQDQFLAGYGFAQAVPGPLFSFAAYLGSISPLNSNPFLSGLLCLVAIFLPSYLLVIGVLPFWETLRKKSAMKTSMIAVNSAVVGLLLAALYRPVWTSAIFSTRDFTLALLAFLLLNTWRVPAWAVVLFCAVAVARL